MKRGRRVIFTLLVYVTLDLSLPGMPGAFVFEPADSVESTQRSLGRAAGEVVPASRPVSSAVAALSRIPSHEAPQPARTTRPARVRVVSPLARATLTPPPLSEDPQ